MRSRFLLTATRRDGASVSSAAFHVDRGLVRHLRAGDTLHLKRTYGAGLGLSVLRDGRLVVAVGAVTCVQLGDDITATLPWELLEQAEAVLKARYPAFRFREKPIEIAVASHPPMLLAIYNGTIGPYRVFIRHGFLLNIPGDSELAAISRVGLCADVAAQCAAMLLALNDGFEMAHWESR